MLRGCKWLLCWVLMDLLWNMKLAFQIVLCEEILQSIPFVSTFFGSFICLCLLFPLTCLCFILLVSPQSSYFLRAGGFSWMLALCWLFALFDLILWFLSPSILLCNVHLELFHLDSYFELIVIGENPNPFVANMLLCWKRKGWGWNRGSSAFYDSNSATVFRAEYTSVGGIGGVWATCLHHVYCHPLSLSSPRVRKPLSMHVTVMSENAMVYLN